MLGGKCLWFYENYQDIQPQVKPLGILCLDCTSWLKLTIYINRLSQIITTNDQNGITRKDMEPRSRFIFATFRGVRSSDSDGVHFMCHYSDLLLRHPQSILLNNSEAHKINAI